MTSAAAASPPGRAVLRTAGLLTQLGCAACLLIGTIAFVVSRQNGDGGGLAIAWALAAMGGLISGSLMTRGALAWVLACAALDLGFGITLIATGHDAARALLRLLADTDAELVGDVLLGVGVGLAIAGALCLAAIPQAVRYVRWLHAADAPAETMLGIPPPPAPRRSLWRLPAQAGEGGSRRRLYFALGGFAIGLGAGVGVLISSMNDGGAAATRAAADPGSEPAEPGQPADPARPDAAGSPGDGSAAGSAPAAAEPPAADTLVEAQRAAIARGDLAAVVATVWPDAVGFGVDADEVAIGRDALAAQLGHDLGDLSGGTTATVHGVQIGGERGHAWIAYDLSVTAAGRGLDLAVTELAAWIGGRWQVVAWHWARPVSDRDAERVAVLGTKPVPRIVPAKVVGPRALDAAVRAAFASRAAFIDAYSARADGFNFGSAPGERIAGGAAIRRVFGKLHAEIARRDGPYVIAGGAWDPAQHTAPWIAAALLDADFTGKTRAGTPLTHTFRVLAILVDEAGAWKLVQTQWSHGGPI